MDDDNIKVGWRALPLTDALIQAHLAEKLSEVHGGTVMLDLDQKSRSGRTHLKLHRDRDGKHYVRVGRRGSCKQYLGRCKVTYLDGVATLFQFTLAAHDAFEAEQRRRWDERNGFAPCEAEVG